LRTDGKARDATDDFRVPSVNVREQMARKIFYKLEIPHHLVAINGEPAVAIIVPVQGMRSRADRDKVATILTSSPVLDTSNGRFEILYATVSQADEFAFIVASTPKGFAMPQAKVINLAAVLLSKFTWFTLEGADPAACGVVGTHFDSVEMYHDTVSYNGSPIMSIFDCDVVYSGVYGAEQARPGLQDCVGEGPGAREDFTFYGTGASIVEGEVGGRERGQGAGRLAPTNQPAAQQGESTSGSQATIRDLPRDPLKESHVLLDDDDESHQRRPSQSTRRYSATRALRGEDSDSLLSKPTRLAGMANPSLELQAPGRRGETHSSRDLPSHVLFERRSKAAFWVCSGDLSKVVHFAGGPVAAFTVKEATLREPVHKLYLALSKWDRCAGAYVERIGGAPMAGGSRTTASPGRGRGQLAKRRGEYRERGAAKEPREPRETVRRGTVVPKTESGHAATSSSMRAANIYILARRGYCYKLDAPKEAYNYIVGGGHATLKEDKYQYFVSLSPAVPEDLQEQMFNIGGITDSACVKCIERVLVDEGCYNINISAGSGLVSALIPPAAVDKVCERVRGAGFTCKAVTGENFSQEVRDISSNPQHFRKWFIRCMCSLGALVVILALDFTQPTLPTSGYYQSLHGSNVTPSLLVVLLLTFCDLFVLGFPIIRGGFEILRNKGLAMETTLAIALLIMFLYDTVLVICDLATSSRLFFHTNFSAIAIIISLVCANKCIEIKARQLTSKPYLDLAKHLPEEATMVKHWKMPEVAAKYFDGEEVGEEDLPAPEGDRDADDGPTLHGLLAHDTLGISELSEVSATSAGGGKAIGIQLDLLERKKRARGHDTHQNTQQSIFQGTAGAFVGDESDSVASDGESDSRSGSTETSTPELHPLHRGSQRLPDGEDSLSHSQFAAADTALTDQSGADAISACYPHGRLTSGQRRSDQIRSDQVRAPRAHPRSSHSIHPLQRILQTRYHIDDIIRHLSGAYDPAYAKYRLVAVQARTLFPGSVVRIFAGACCPCDGVIIHGSSEVDESVISGRRTLVKVKHVGDKIFAGTTVINSDLYVCTAHVGKETFIGQIFDDIQRAQRSRTNTPEIQKLADRASAAVTPLCVGLSFLMFVVWLALTFTNTVPVLKLGRILYGLDFEIGRDASHDDDIRNYTYVRITMCFQILSAMLIASCSPSLSMAVPICALAGAAKGSKLGIIFRGCGKVAERMCHVTQFVLSKSGTLTFGQPVVEGIVVPFYPPVMLSYLEASGDLVRIAGDKFAFRRDLRRNHTLAAQQGAKPIYSANNGASGKDGPASPAPVILPAVSASPGLASPTSPVIAASGTEDHGCAIPADGVHPEDETPGGMPDNTSTTSQCPDPAHPVQPADGPVPSATSSSVSDQLHHREEPRPRPSPVQGYTFLSEPCLPASAQAEDPTASNAAAGTEQEVSTSYLPDVERYHDLSLIELVPPPRPCKDETAHDHLGDVLPGAVPSAVSSAVPLAAPSAAPGAALIEPTEPIEAPEHPEHAEHVDAPGTPRSPEHCPAPEGPSAVLNPETSTICQVDLYSQEWLLSNLATHPALRRLRNKYINSVAIKCLKYYAALAAACDNPVLPACLTAIVAFAKGHPTRQYVMGRRCVRDFALPEVRNLETLDRGELRGVLDGRLVSVSDSLPGDSYTGVGPAGQEGRERHELPAWAHSGFAQVSISSTRLGDRSGSDPGIFKYDIYPRVDDPAGFFASHASSNFLALEIDGDPIALINVSDLVRPEASSFIKEAARRGYRSYMLTSDLKTVSKKLGASVGIRDENVVYEVAMPMKPQVLRYISKYGSAPSRSSLWELASNPLVPTLFGGGKGAQKVTYRREKAENAPAAIETLGSMSLGADRKTLVASPSSIPATAVERSGAAAEVTEQQPPAKGLVTATTAAAAASSVSFVCDGIGDLICVPECAVSVAVGSGEECITSLVDVVLLSSQLTDIITLIDFSRVMRVVMRTVIVLSILYIIVMIPLCAGVLIPVDRLVFPLTSGVVMSVMNILVILVAFSVMLYKPKVW